MLRLQDRPSAYLRKKLERFPSCICGKAIRFSKFNAVVAALDDANIPITPNQALHRTRVVRGGRQ